MPTEVIVTQADVDDIAKKLDEFGAVLNDREKAVLLGVLGLAAEGINAASQAASGSSSSTAPLPSLSSGFRNAFQRGVGSRFRIVTSQTEATSRCQGHRRCRCCLLVSIFKPQYRYTKHHRCRRKGFL